MIKLAMTCVRFRLPLRCAKARSLERPAEHRNPHRFPQAKQSPVPDRPVGGLERVDHRSTVKSLDFQNDPVRDRSRTTPRRPSGSGAMPRAFGRARPSQRRAPAERQPCQRVRWPLQRVAPPGSDRTSERFAGAVRLGTVSDRFRPPGHSQTRQSRTPRSRCPCFRELRLPRHHPRDSIDGLPEEKINLTPKKWVVPKDDPKASPSGRIRRRCELRA